MLIRTYTPNDEAAVTDVVARAFGQDDEANLVLALRDEGVATVELVAEENGQIVGHVLFSEMQEPAGWLAIAPVSVHPDHQGSGVGSSLIREALDSLDVPVVVLGNPDYYSRFGFDYDRASDLNSPFPIEYTGLYDPKPAGSKPTEKLVYAKAFSGS